MSSGPLDQEDPQAAQRLVDSRQLFAEPSESSPPSGSGRYTAVGATLGFGPLIFSGGLALLDKLSSPTWQMIAIIMASPIVGASFGLLSYVVMARTDRESAVIRTEVQAVADSVRQAACELTELKPGHVIEVAVTRVLDGCQGTVRYRKDSAGIE